MSNHLEEKPKSKKKGIFVIICIIIIIIAIASNGEDKSSPASSNDISVTNDNDNSVANNNTTVEKSQVIYEDKNFLVKITDYEYKNITDRIIVKVYIENNSNINTSFTISGSISIDGYTLSGGYFYEEIQANTKANKEFYVYDLKTNNLDGTNVKELKFNFDIYQSENYIIKNRIIENKAITYIFK